MALLFNAPLGAEKVTLVGHDILLLGLRAHSCIGFCVVIKLSIFFLAVSSS